MSERHGLPAVLLSVGVVLLALLVGCTQVDPLTEHEVALYDSDGSALEAAGGGTVTREDGCLYLVGDGYRTVPVFPRGSVSWDGVTLEFRGESYREGDTISFGGGESAPPPRASIPPGCDPGASTWLVAPR